jgi:hypothetical protein
MSYGAEIFCGSGRYIKECEKKKDPRSHYRNWNYREKGLKNPIVQ